MTHLFSIAAHIRLPHVVTALLFTIICGCNPLQQRPKLVDAFGDSVTVSGLSWMPDSAHLVIKLMWDQHQSRAFMVPVAGGQQQDLGYCSRPVDPQATPDGKRVLLTDLDGRLVLRTPVDGGGYTVYTPAADALMTDAALAPDGKEIAVIEEVPGTKLGQRLWRLRLVDAVGRLLRQKTESISTPGMVNWSPDGRLLMWTRCHPEYREVVILDAATLAVVDEWSAPGDWTLQRQCWGPDSKQYIGLGASENGERAVWITAVPAQQIENLCSAPMRHGGEAAWQPGGRLLALSNITEDKRGTTVSMIHVIDIDNGDIKKYFGRLKGAVSWLTWSPSGDQIAFVRLNRVEVVPVE